MVNFIERKILSTGVLLLCVTACGGGGGGASETNLTATDERTQSEIEAMARLSLASHSPSEDFSFTTQRQVNFHFDFSAVQSSTQVSIYIQDGDEPASLLEQGEISNASQYITSLSVPTYFNSVQVVINNNTSAPYNVAINNANVAHYTFND